MIVQGMYGLGDNVYQRAFIKRLPKPLYLRTPWVELYQDIPGVYFVKPDLGLRTQSKNILAKSADTWTNKQKYAMGREIIVGYGKNGMIPGMIQRFGCEPDAFDLPPFEPPELGIAGKYAVIRPVTVRQEWKAESRNCKPEYVQQAAEILRQRGYTIVSVADLEDGKEWAVEPLPYADITLHKGELDVSSLLGLIRCADVVVGAVGFILPVSIAYNVPCWVILGGYGAYNHPSLVTDKRYMDLSKIGFAVPENFCKCDRKDHRCNKDIKNHEQKFTDWLGKISALDA